MKRIVLLSLSLALTFNICKGQTTTVKNSPLDEHTIVKDSTGNVVPYETWKNAISTGNYTVRSRYTEHDTTHTLHLLSTVEKERIQKQIEQIKAEHPEMRPAVEGQGAVNVSPITSTSYVPNHLPRQSASFHNGELFKPFKDKDINGNKIDIGALQGKIVVINFWFVKCPACRYEIPELNTVAAEYANNPNVVFIGMCLDQRWVIKDFIKVMPFNFQHVANATHYGTSYGVNLYPTTLVLDKQGVIRFNSVGADNTGYWIKKTIKDISSEN